MIKVLFVMFIMLTIFDSVVSFIPQYRHQVWAGQIRRIVDIPQRPIRKILPPDMPIDLSPLVVIMLFKLLMTLG